MIIIPFSFLTPSLCLSHVLTVCGGFLCCMPLLEWKLFREMCATGEPLPFDQLLIELHGCEESLVAELVECLDKHGI